MQVGPAEGGVDMAGFNGSVIAILAETTLGRPTFARQ